MPLATHLFLRELDLLAIQKWEYKVEDKSILSRIYDPVWERLAKLVPRSVAPNVVTLCALVCVLQAFWLATKYGTQEDYHTATCYAAALLTYMYVTLDSIDGKVARNTLNSSPMGEFVDHGCDNIAGTFQVVTVLILCGVETSDTMWYVVQALQLASLSVHISAFGDRDRKIRFGYIFSPELLLHFFVGLLLVAGNIGTVELWAHMKALVLHLYDNYGEQYVMGDWHRARYVAACNGTNDADREILAEWIVASAAGAAYWCSILAVVTQVLLLPARHFPTKFGFLLSLLMRSVPAILLFWHWREPSDVDMETILSDGLFLSILCSDIIVAKMADRDLHSLVPVMAMASVLSNTVIFAGVLLYHATVLLDMCLYLNLPLLNPNINVYCDGVFDLLHLGHMRQFEQAIRISNGTRLIVGVLSDKVATGYKRKPVLSEDERYASVAACKFVHKVVKDAPLITDEAFIRKHQIHVFAVGEEYVDDPDDEFYAVPRRLGLLKATARTDGVSTSELIRRINRRDKSSLGRVAPPKQGI